MKRRKIRHGVSWYKRKLDRVFSLWIRQRDPACVTCGSKASPQNGHFVSRSCNQLRYDERNCHRQCMRCNVFLNGNMVEYAAFMVRTYGYGIIDELRKEKVKMKSFTVKELEELIKLYE